MLRVGRDPLRALQERVRSQGVAQALAAVSGIEPASDLGRLVQSEYEVLSTGGA